MSNKQFNFQVLDESISIEDHNPAWSTWFADEVISLSKVFIKLQPQFAHIGSSAVPGLKSKPIVDIMIGLNKLVLSIEEQNALTLLGYEYFGRLHKEHDRLFARKRGSCSFNLQIVPFRGKEWSEKLIFRDYLRAHSDEVKAYSAIKDEAVRLGKKQLLDYHHHKDKVVSEILQRALEWSSII